MKKYPIRHWQAAITQIQPNRTDLRVNIAALHDSIEPLAIALQIINWLWIGFCDAAHHVEYLFRNCARTLAGQFLGQKPSITSAAAVAVVSAIAVFIVPAIAILAAAHRAGAMLVFQELLFDAQSSEYASPPTTGFVHHITHCNPTAHSSYLSIYE